MAREGLDTLLFDYRGYGRSEGRPSEEGLYRDGEAARRWAEGQGLPVVLYGESLGGAVAVELAVRRAPALLVVQSSFTSLPELAAQLVPLGGLLRGSGSPRWRRSAGSPPRCWWCTANRDEVVPYQMGQRLFGGRAGAEGDAHHPGGRPQRSLRARGRGDRPPGAADGRALNQDPPPAGDCCTIGAMGLTAVAISLLQRHRRRAARPALARPLHRAGVGRAARAVEAQGGLLSAGEPVREPAEPGLLRPGLRGHRPQHPAHRQPRHRQAARPGLFPEQYRSRLPPGWSRSSAATPRARSSTTRPSR